MAQTKELDITKTGPVGYKSLQAQNNSQYDEIDDFINKSQSRILSRASQSDPYRDMQQMVLSPLSTTDTPWGESMFDNKTANQADFENLGDVRAENQPWYSKIGAGLAKGAILAGTTFLDGTVGLVLGVDTAIKEERWSGLWDNDFSKAMQAVNEWSELVLPNYYTQAELEGPWYENVFTANFLGDKFIKNLGFTIGAFYSGGLEAAGIRGLGKLAMSGAKRLGAGIKTLKGISNATSIVAAGLGSATSAVNEGRIEALNNSKDWFELHKTQLDTKHNQRLQAIKDAYEGTEIYDQLIMEEQDAYNQALGKLSEDRLKMGNMDLLMNLPILMASNVIQFGKLYANGFKTSRKAYNILGRPGEYKAGTTRLGATYDITKGALSEGVEEISQKAASIISGNYYSTDVNNFYKSKTDRDAAQETLDWTKAFAQGINETVNDGSSWEEFFIGSLTGALGMPRFRSIRNTEGRLQSPITLEEGAINEWREYNKQIARENEIADYMNNRINSPEFKNYYQGLVRHNKYQNDMNKAAEEGNEFDFKNAEHAQLVSDIVMFDQAGKLGDLTEAIEATTDYSDEELQSIVKNTTSVITKEEQEKNINSEILNIQAEIQNLETSIAGSSDYLNSYKRQKSPAIKYKSRDEKGRYVHEERGVNASRESHIQFMEDDIEAKKKRKEELNQRLNDLQKQSSSINEKSVGPFIDKNGNPMYATPEGKQEMIEKLKQNHDEIVNTINNYQKIKDELILKTGQQLSDEQLEELTWMKSQISNWSKRAEAMSGEVKSAIGSVLSNLDSFLRFNEQVRDFEGQTHAGLTDTYRSVDKNVRAIQGAINTLNLIKSQDDKALAYTLATSPEFVDGLIKEITEVDETVLSADEKSDIINKLNDIIKLGNASKTYNAKLREYLANPQKQVEDHIRADNLAAQQETKKKADDLKVSLNSAKNLQEFRTILDNQDDAENRDKVLKEMEDEGNTMAKNYRETSQYNTEVRRVINESDAEPQVKQDAMKLLQDQFSNSENLEQLANPNSIYINNENAFDEDSNGDVDLSATRFQEAQYALLKAMSKINNDNKFKDRFSPEYKKPVEKREGAVRGDNRKDTTGDSGTSTTPTVKGSSKDLPKADLPLEVGNITHEMVKDENRKANEAVEAPLRPSKDTLNPFYRPAIPELHIEASKEGDFRPFVEVVAEREGGDYSEIYNYLLENKAFEYINQGNLKVGDEIGFMIDPEFEKRVEGKEWHTAPTIFLIDKKNGHIVGSLDEGTSVNNYIGLKSLEERIRREYKNARKIQKPYHFTSMAELLGDKKSNWEYYRDDVIREYGGIEFVTGSSYQSALEPAINLAVDSGVLPRKYKKYLGRTKENAIEKEDLQEIIDELKKLGINSPSELINYVDKNESKSGETEYYTINVKELRDRIEAERRNNRDSYAKMPQDVIRILNEKVYKENHLDPFDYNELVKLSNNTFLQDILNDYITPVTSGTQSRFIATPTTKVAKIMVGRIPYDSTERSLNTILGEGKTPIFGIIKNGILDTNKDADIKINYDDIIKPLDMSKEGRLYLLIPNGAGKYSPAAVRVKHFNKEEFNLDDVLVSSTPIGKDIKDAITKLSTAISQDDVSLAMQDLAQALYMQDIMVTWFDGRAGSGIVISKKVRKPDGTYEKVTINGKEQIKEDKYDVYFSTSKKNAEIGGINFDVTALENLGDTSTLGTPKDPDDIYKEILGHLIKFNLPLQVSTGRINKGGYNERLINSNILTSNITEASVKGTWFTTDYFDNEGNLHKAISPASVAPKPKRKVETPVGGKEGAIPGTKIVSVFSNKSYYVDLKTNTIRNDQGKTEEVTDKNRILFDLAWAQDNFGDAKNSSMMVDNKVLTPDGKVLDRSKQEYLSGQEAQDVKDIIAGRKKEQEDRVAKSKEVINEIYENQKRVDKTKTDNNFYYILEDDGKYHQYSRVHSRLGSNWEESPKQAEDLAHIRTRLSQLVDNLSQFNNYLKYLGNQYKVNLDDYQGKTDAKSRDAIVNTVRDNMLSTNSQRALEAGSAVDSIIRQYFTVKDVSKIVRPSNITESAFTDLISTLNNIKSKMEARGERFLTDNIVLFLKYPDGTRVAGEVDILSVDKNGIFRIYDVKTRRYSFYSEGGLNLFDWTINGLKATKEEVQNYIDRNFKKPFTIHSNMSDKDYYTLQLSAYKNLFESQYGVPITTLGIMPFVMSYDNKNVSEIKNERGIPITYNPAVNVPLVSTVKTDKPVETATSAQAQTVLPIFETSLETQNPIDRILPENSLGKDSIVGYYEKDGKLYKGYIKKAGEVEGVPIHITKERDKGFGRKGEINESSSYFVILPNGKLVDTGTLSKSDEEAFNVIMRALSAKPQKVKDMSNEKTILFDPTSAPTVSAAPVTTVETPATINQGNTLKGAALTAQKEQAVMADDDEFEDDLDLGKLRRADDETRGTWNQEKELAWIKKVLPQLSENDRVKVVKGLIKVGKKGTLAWGKFDKGIITLSDIAAEGTAYHEAFHVVFNLLLDQNERISLLNEYRSKHPNMDDRSLEEELAEDFREFVMQGGKDTRSLGRKIIDFFKSLFIKTKYWKNFRPSSIYYFRAINEGKYSGKDMPITTLNEARYKQEEYTQEMLDILANAPRDSQGRLLAPNGEVSNLTERQYAQVRTKAFKEWFGDWENDPANASKVVDENGEPLVVYHGGSNTKIFDTSGNRSGGAGIKKGIKGTYFTTSEKNAEFYEEIYGFKTSEQWIAYADELREQGASEEEIKALDKEWENERPTTRAFFLNIKNPIETHYYGNSKDGYTEKSSIPNKSDGQHIEIEDKEYEEYVATNPNQVKSATDNIGTFSTTNDDIRYRVVPNSSFEVLRAEEKEMLLNKGWTEEKFNSISQEERDYALRCIAF